MSWIVFQNNQGSHSVSVETDNVEEAMQAFAKLQGRSIESLFYTDSCGCDYNCGPAWEVEENFKALSDETAYVFLEKPIEELKWDGTSRNTYIFSKDLPADLKTSQEQ